MRNIKKFKMRKRNAGSPNKVSEQTQPMHAKRNEEESMSRVDASTHTRTVLLSLFISNTTQFTFTYYCAIVQCHQVIVVLTTCCLLVLVE